MANQEQLDLLKQGIAVWNTWRNQIPEVWLDLRDSDLSGANLVRADLSGANLVRADLSGANLVRADLSGANLVRADLSGARLNDTNLIEANLSGANLFYANLVKADLSGTDLSEAELISADIIRTNLRGANLTHANLIRANLVGANLVGANLSGAVTELTTFADVDLSSVKGLVTVKHYGPSSIGIDTIYRSQGKIPERFLRDAGVPDTLMDYLHSLVSQPIQYFTCFISHSRKDQRFCDRLYADLRGHHVPSWYFPEDATWGKSVWGEIDLSIKLYDKLVVVCSEHSLQSSPVLREIERALQREDREGKHILFPLRIDNYLFEQWEHERKADVLSKVVGDFRGWNRNAEKYDRAFQRFLKALKE